MNIVAIFTGWNFTWLYLNLNTSFESLFNKIASLNTCKFIKKRLCFLVNIAKL